VDATFATPAERPRPLRGTVSVPGDKSISHRALILGALGRGRSLVHGLNRGRDVASTIALVTQLGAACEPAESNDELYVDGCGWDGLREPQDVVDAGNSGTTARLGLGLLAGAPLGAALTGDLTLRRRPMLRVVVPLRAMGARIDGRADGDRLPLWIRGGALRGIEWDTRVASAQVKSALLLAGLRATGPTSVTEPAPSRDHTERMLAAAGVDVRRSGRTVTVEGGVELSPFDRVVPGDLSAAMFLLVGASLIPGSDLTVGGVGLNPTRGGALEVLARMGADLTVERVGEHGGEPYGNVTARATELSASEVRGDEVPALIDEVPALAVAASQASGTTRIGGAQELRVKESDRIDSVARTLAALGGEVEALPDGLLIRGPTRLHGGSVDAAGDHRIALAAALAGVVAGARVEVRDWSCVETSWPGWEEAVREAQGEQP